MDRTDFIQSVIDKIGAKSYLEIGVQYGINFKKIVCERKVGIDPADYDWDILNRENNVYLLKVGSDEFFESNEEKFDVIFIDGLHEHEQVIEDFINSLSFINEDGVIILHDCRPRNKEEQTVPETHMPSWTGDVWKAWLFIRTYEEFNCFCIDIDTGMGLVLLEPSESVLSMKLEDIKKMDYEDLEKDKERLLNLRGENYFKNILEELVKV